MSVTKNKIEERLKKLTPRQRELMERLIVESTPKSQQIPRRPADMNQVVPSFGQERIWFMDKLIPYQAAFCVPSAVRLYGELDPDALCWALNQIIERHEVLRTVLIEEDDKPFQVIQSEFKLTLPVDDLRSFDDPEEEARRRAALEPFKSFNLDTGPLIRTRLFQLGDHDHVFVVTLHHIVSDAWTLGILFHELESLYAARIGLEVEPLPELPTQYADYALWQRQSLQGEKLEKLVDYWRTHLQGIPEVIGLPTDRPRPPQRSTMGKFYPVRFEPSLIQKIRALGQQEKTTLHITLLAGFKAVLARYSRQPDVVVGVPIASRTRSETQPLIGFFLNWLILRTHVGDDPPFRELLRRVRKAALDGYAHQDIPFEILLQTLQPRRNLSTSPLFQVSFSVQDSPYQLPRLAGVEMEPFQFEGSASHYDLMADLWLEEDGAIVGNFPYNDEIFDEQTIGRIVAHMKHLLAAAINHLDQPISKLPLHANIERQNLLNIWPKTAEKSEPFCLHERFIRQVTHTPTATAVTFENKTLTYMELNQKANKLAHLLQSLGTGPETIVAICVERSLEMIVGILAILKAGAAYLPLDPDYPKGRLAYMLADAQAVVLLSHQAVADRIPEQHPEIIWLDADQEQIKNQPDTDPISTAKPDNTAYIIYTSGSTGTPKGVLVTHNHVNRLFAATQPWFNFNDNDVWTLFHSYAFDFSVWEIWGALLYGGELVVVPYWVTRAPEEFLNLLVERGVTVLNQTPSAFAQFQTIATASEDLDLQLRYIIFGGEALDLNSLRPWFERFGDQTPRLINMYGITETTVHVTYYPLSWDDLKQGRPSLIGCPIPDLTLYILDKHLEPVPIGVPGELYVGGAGVTRGYQNQPQLTASRFLPDPFVEDSLGSRMYRTGDLARILPDGNLAYLGRIDDQVKIRGHRIELGEIQSVLRQCAGVKESVISAREDILGQKRLVAYVVAAGEQRPTVTELRRTLQTKLPDYMIPSAFVFLDAFPLTLNGKIDRKALPSPSVKRPELERTYLPPRTAEEQLIANILADVLNVEQVGALDNFFDLGGHSLVAVQVISKIRQLAEVELSIITIFTQPTVEGLALALAEKASASSQEEKFDVANADEIVSSLSDQEVEALLATMQEDSH